MKQHVLAAFAEWLRLGEVRPADAGSLAAHPLTTAALEGLGDPEAFDGACDAVVELVYASSAGPAWGEPDQSATPLVARLVPAVGRRQARCCSGSGLHGCRLLLLSCRSV